jgi:hypothetical protein
MKMRGRRFISIVEVTTKAEDKGKYIVNSFLKYHALDPNSAEDSFDGLLHAIMSSRDYYCKSSVTNQELCWLTSAHGYEKNTFSFK